MKPNIRLIHDSGEIEELLLPWQLGVPEEIRNEERVFMLHMQTSDVYVYFEEGR